MIPPELMINYKKNYLANMLNKKEKNNEENIQINNENDPKIKEFYEKMKIFNYNKEVEQFSKINPFDMNGNSNCKNLYELLKLKLDEKIKTKETSIQETKVSVRYDKPKRQLSYIPERFEERKEKKILIRRLKMLNPKNINILDIKKDSNLDFFSKKKHKACIDLVNQIKMREAKSSTNLPLLKIKPSIKASEKSTELFIEEILGKYRKEVFNSIPKSIPSQEKIKQYKSDFSEVIDRIMNLFTKEGRKCTKLADQLLKTLFEKYKPNEYFRFNSYNLKNLLDIDNEFHTNLEKNYIENKYEFETKISSVKKWLQ